MRPWLFLVGVLLLVVPEVLRVYFIMPFPGSQEDVPSGDGQVNLAFWLHTNIGWLRSVGAAFMVGPLIHYLRHGGWWKRLAVVLPAVFCLLVCYAVNFELMADKMFLPPKEKRMASLSGTVPLSQQRSLVIAVERKGDARAYPIELIGYHHQVRDTLGGEVVLVTYCTVCRTGRAWSPKVNGADELFRLVGMDHFNAMFEDGRTGSWWRQATGECIAGPLKGTRLAEVPSEQLTLGEFLVQYPKGLVMQPDTGFAEQYKELMNYDEGTIDSELEYRDTASWQPKSWVVGVVHNGQARAYDWNDLMTRGPIADTLSGDTIHVVIKADGSSFRAFRYGIKWHGIAPGEFQVDPTVEPFRHQWSVPAYQEFWHSWRTFHPNTTRYIPT